MKRNKGWASVLLIRLNEMRSNYAPLKQRRFHGNTVCGNSCDSPKSEYEVSPSVKLSSKFNLTGSLEEKKEKVEWKQVHR